MQRFICAHCDDLECETSICPICGEKNFLTEKKVYWCKHCNSPSYKETCDCCNNKCDELAADLRPVFPEERLLIEVLIGQPMKFCNNAVYSSGGGIYFIDGEKLSLKLTELAKTPAEEVIKQLKEYAVANQYYVDNIYEQDWIKAFIKCNHDRLSLIESEACDFIRVEAKGFGLDSMFVSFSGGKDSTVISNLVMEALGTENVIHIYGDTTLEYPESGEYIKTFREEHPRTPLITAKNRDQDFFDLCRRIGPPSRVLRWCCTVFKTGAINKKIEALFANKTKILAFHGIRREESASRGKYERVSEGAKITKQRVCQPILDWTNFDVWLYLLSKKISFNPAYNEGFSRVGCWCCPNNSAWSEYLSSIYMNEAFVTFRHQLYEFAKSIGKPDWKEYIDEGSWKARQGGNGLEYSDNAKLSFIPCVKEENAYNFILTRPLTESFYNLFIPFGRIDTNLGNQRLGEVYVISRLNGNPLLKITGKLGQNKIRVSVVNQTGPFRIASKAETYIKAQVTKYQTCIGCSACASICKHGAIHIENTKIGDVSPETITYNIDESKCVGCLECILHFDSGCYIKKVLRTRNDSEE